MNMLILKLWDMLSSELQRRQLCESGIAASARLQSVCVSSAHVVSRDRDVSLQRRRLYVCTYMELSIGPVGAMSVGGHVSFRGLPPSMSIDLFAYLYLCGELTACP